MYPQVTQFDTRSWRLAQELELARSRHIAAASGRAARGPDRARQRLIGALSRLAMRPRLSA